MLGAKEFDVVIMGGGIVGLTFACALAKNSSLNIALIEGSSSKITKNLRVSAITYASQRILNSLGVWTSIKDQRVSAFQKMQVWDSQGSGHIHFDSREIYEENLGYIIENNVIQQALLELLEHHPKVSFFFQTKPVALQKLPEKVIIDLDTGVCLSTKLLVGADGAQSWVRKHSDIAMTVHDYEQQAIIATVTTEKPHQKTAWQRFLPTGPLAFLPLEDLHQCSIVWSTTYPHSEELMSMVDECFMQVLTTAFEHRLGSITSISERKHFPLRRQHAKSYVTHRIALVGDAAHTVHPLAGQGVNLGLLDAMCLADVVLKKYHAQRDWGLLQALRRYERSRKGHNQLMMRTMDAFKCLFCNELPPLISLRNIGLNIIDCFAFIKSKLMKFAMGSERELYVQSDEK